MLILQTNSSGLISSLYYWTFILHWQYTNWKEVGILEGRKEGNVLVNDALNTFCLRLYGVGHMVKYNSDSERKPAAATWATLSD